MSSGQYVPALCCYFVKANLDFISEGRGVVVVHLYMFTVRGISISDINGCKIRQTLSIGSELELYGIALHWPRIGIGILLTFLKWQELVLVFY